MDTFCYPRQSFDFTYTYNSPENGEERQVVELLQLPLESNITVRERAFLFLKKHTLPKYLLTDLLPKLDTFIENRIEQLQYEKVAKRLTHKEQILDKCRAFWLQVRHNNLESITTESGSQPKKDTFLHEDNFYLMYHQVIHSGILTPQLIQLENHNSEVIRCLLRERDEFLENLAIEQNQNVESILLSGSFSDKEITTITKNNVLFAEKKHREWKERIASVRSDQKREFSTWIKNTYEDWIQNGPRVSQQVSYEESVHDQEGFLVAKNASEPFIVEEEEDDDEPPMEESYTINLGSQLKTTHNLRLISVDILKFCKNICTPQRLQTAMSLYSNSISAVVRLVDRSISAKTGRFLFLSTFSLV